MKHEVDLDFYNLYTDLTVESIKNRNVNDIEIKENVIGDIKVTEVEIDEKHSSIIGKKIGRYVTIEFEDITDSFNRDEVKKVFMDELAKFINIKKDELVLIVGLGNELSTPDSLGPMCVDNIEVTNHIYELDLLDEDYQRVCSIKPSVLGRTGIETSIIVSSVVKKIKPKCVIVIDSLASSSIDRLNKTIQITDTGINPGSGIGNKRKEISKETLKVPVYAIGVPTVVSALTIISDTINHIFNENKDNILNKYDEIKTIIDEILKENELDLVVTPTEIDYIMESLSKVISEGINNLFNKTV